MAKAIFYDLETTDTSLMGQILNFCFMVADDDFNIIDKFSDTIKISRLQLPHASAINANRTDVLKHQQESTLSESQAVEKIASFINGIVESEGDYKASLIGYNSADFDLRYLRTVFIRNGFNPYFKVLHKDLYLLSQKLRVSSERFSETVTAFCEDNDLKPNLKLETLCKSHKLLSGAQLHESEDDVRLTVELAKEFLDRYGFDVRSYEPYEAKKLHRARRGSVFVVRERFKNKVKITYKTLLFHDYRQALWVDLDEYAKRKEAKEDTTGAIRWFKFDSKTFFTEGEVVELAEYQKLAKEALEEFKSINIDNYFGETNCDIEQFIYRISPGQINPLRAVFTKKRKPGKLTSDQKELYLRYRLANYELGSDKDQAMQSALKEYALYRYGGKAKLDKRVEVEPGPDQKGFHPTFNSLVDEIDKTTKQGDKETKKLMESLRKFYYESEIYQVAGDELVGVE